MGSACCVAAGDRNIINAPTSDIVQRNVRYSPSWNFRWENRGRVAGEEAPVNWFTDGNIQNNRLDIKYQRTLETTYGSEDESPLDSSQTPAWQKSPCSEVNAEVSRLPSLDHSVSGILSNVASIDQQVKEITELPAVPDPSPVKLSPSIPSVSSFSPSPSSPQSHLVPASSTPLRLSRRSPGRKLYWQASDNQIPVPRSSNFSVSEEATSFILPGWSNDSNRSSQVGSSGGSSVPVFSDLVGTSRRERWSFDSESFGFNCGNKISRSSCQSSASPSSDMQTCGVCLKLLTEKSLLSTQKIISTNELAVVAVLICGHAYHSECLENMTPEVNKYDPTCPVCTFGQKQTVKLGEKAMKSGMDFRAKIKKFNKRSRNWVMKGDLENDSIVFDRQESSGYEGKGFGMSPSSSSKVSRRPSLKPYFSFGSKESKSMATDTISTRKKGLFWSKSSKQ